VSFQSLLRGLVQDGVWFVVVGGVAAAAHGSPRVTNDLDICYDAEPANLDRLARLLAQWSAYPRGADAGLHFIMDPRTLTDAPLLTLQTTEGDLDVMDQVPGVGGFREVLQASVALRAFGIEFAALDLPALIASKRAAARPKDWAQLPELTALLELRREERGS
jgi:hypothetical protein